MQAFSCFIHCLLPTIRMALLPPPKISPPPLAFSPSLYALISEDEKRMRVPELMTIVWRPGRAKASEFAAFATFSTTISGRIVMSRSHKKSLFATLAVLLMLSIGLSHPAVKADVIEKAPAAPPTPTAPAPACRLMTTSLSANQPAGKQVVKATKLKSNSRPTAKSAVKNLNAKASTTGYWCWDRYWYEWVPCYLLWP